MLTLKYLDTDNGNCRVYYRNGKSLYAFQEDRRDQFTLYVCSRDGEPSHECTEQFELNKEPAEECSTSRAFNKWLSIERGKMGQALLDALTIQ